MDQHQQEAEFLKFVDQSILWFNRHATPNNIAYNLVRAALILLGVILPLLAAQKCVLAASIVSIVIALLAGLDSLFKPGEMWRHFRGVQLTLERLKRDYERARSQLPDNDPNGRTKLFNQFFAQVEQVLKDEAEGFWQMRVTPTPKAGTETGSSQKASN